MTIKKTKPEIKGRSPDYEWAVSKAYKENIEDLRKNIHRADYLKKIESFSKKFNYSMKDVIEKIKEDEMYAVHFVKDPLKQSIHEKTAANFISNNNDVQNFVKLPGSGANSLFLHDSKIISKKEHDDLKLTSKSIDFYWEVKVNSTVMKFYASHKYTNEGGGNQDHQFHELQRFMESSSEVKQEHTYFLALCDGDFYQEPFRKGVNGSRLDYLKDFSKGRNVAISLNELDRFIAKQKLMLQMLSPVYEGQIVFEELEENKIKKQKKLRKAKIK